MQSLVGIFRTEEDLTKSLVELEKLKQRAAKVKVKARDSSIPAGTCRATLNPC